jgi:hypothetical protein
MLHIDRATRLETFSFWIVIFTGCGAFWLWIIRLLIEVLTK